MTSEQLRTAWRDRDRAHGIARLRQALALPVYFLALVSEVVTTGLTMVAAMIAGDP
jgi:hypothetical protein